MLELCDERKQILTMDKTDVRLLGIANMSYRCAEMRFSVVM